MNKLPSENTTPPISAKDIERNPFLVESKFVLKNGEEAVFRPLVKGDVIAFGTFLDNLSEETRKRFGLHPINSAEAKNICDNLNYSDRLPLVVLNSKDEIIG